MFTQELQSFCDPLQCVSLGLIFPVAAPDIAHTQAHSAQGDSVLQLFFHQIHIVRPLDGISSESLTPCSPR